MSFENWIENWKKNRELKMKEKFSFLIEEMHVCENRITKQLSEEVDKKLLPKLEDSFETFNNDWNNLSDRIEKNYTCTQEILMDLKNQCEKIETSTAKNIKSIINKIEDAEADRKLAQECTEKLMSDSTKVVLVNIEELESLLKIIAVNNLLDEIDIEEEKSTRQK